MTGEWTARAACPQCGAEVEVEVGGSVLACGFCRTRLYLAARGPLEYRLPAGPGHAGAELFHLPYWRVRGLRFAALADPPEVATGLLDLTVPATPHLPAASCLGIRPQAAPLTLAPGLSPALPASTPRLQALEAALVYLPRQGKELLSCLLGEGDAVVQAPHRLEDHSEYFLLVEAFPDGKAHRISVDAAQALRAALAAPRTSRLAFLPLLCPECGSDLPAEAGAAALLCPRCALAWRVRDGRFSPLPFEIRGKPQGEERLFPFWALTVEAADLSLRTMADLSRLAEPYRVRREGWEDRPCELLIPAFKIAPNVFLRLARMMTLGTQGIGVCSEAGGTRLLRSEAVRLPVEEAREALPAVLCSLSAAKRKSFPLIAGAGLSVPRAKLVFFPFRLRGAEWFHEETGQALRAETVRYGANL